MCGVPREENEIDLLYDALDDGIHIAMKQNNERCQNCAHEGFLTYGIASHRRQEEGLGAERDGHGDPRRTQDGPPETTESALETVSQPLSDHNETVDIHRVFCIQTFGGHPQAPFPFPRTLTDGDRKLCLPKGTSEWSRTRPPHYRNLAPASPIRAMGRRSSPSSTLSARASRRFRHP